MRIILQNALSYTPVTRPAPTAIVREVGASNRPIRPFKPLLHFVCAASDATIVHAAREQKGKAKKSPPPASMQRVTVRAAASAAASLRPPSATSPATEAFSVSVAHLLDGRARHYEHIPTRASVLSAVDRMRSLGVGSLIVLDERVLDGIVTERDVLANIPRLLRAGAAAPLAVGDIMSRNPVTVDASATIGEAMAIMSDNNFRHLPVADEGELVGVVSIRDIVNRIVKDHHGEVSRLSTELRRLASVLGDEAAAPAATWQARLRDFFAARAPANAS